MKKITTIVACCILSASAFTQIPNQGFETWNNMGAYSNPDQWGTLNNTTALASVYTATKGTPGNPGSSYLKLTSKTTPAGVANGIAVSGKLDSTTMQPKSGFAFSQQPTKFTGSWQHMIFGNSQGSVSATLTMWNVTTKMREVVATANQTLSGMAMSWANFSISFTYVSGNMPDSCIIVLKASGSNPTNGDYLWVDNLALSGTATGVENYGSNIDDLSVYYNSSGNTIFIDFNLIKSQNVKIQMIDLNGKLVKEVNPGFVNGITNYSMSADGIAKGAYFINVIANEESEVKKIVIN
ncbi:MAG: T9SS type A sorting domain-containing protein [Bacteroidetes bacterium]|nr:MAG: T9SS type A sorting domain-containing protein [Bacteroidota bacterium]